MDCEDPGCRGWMVEAETGEVERCDLCKRFETDDDAAEAYCLAEGLELGVDVVELEDGHWYRVWKVHEAEERIYQELTTWRVAAPSWEVALERVRTGWEKEPIEQRATDSDWTGHTGWGRTEDEALEALEASAAAPRTALSDQRCPECGGALERDEVDVGVGVQVGPSRCDSCGWTESGLTLPGLDDV